MQAREYKRFQTVERKMLGHLVPVFATEMLSLIGGFRTISVNERIPNMISFLYRVSAGRSHTKQGEGSTAAACV